MLGHGAGGLSKAGGAGVIGAGWGKEGKQALLWATYSASCGVGRSVRLNSHPTTLDICAG